MKKGRPRFLITVLAKLMDVVLMQETKTLGVHVPPSVHRYALEGDNAG